MKEVKLKEQLDFRQSVFVDKELKILDKAREWNSPALIWITFESPETFTGVFL